MTEKIEPAPTPEEVAAIVAALRVLDAGEAAGDAPSGLRRDRWRLAGLLGHPPPPTMKLDGALWAYSSWEG